MRPLILLAALVVVGAFAAPAEPCSRILWNDSGRAVLVGRNMDWFEDLKSNVWVLPRGAKRNGHTAQNPMTWTSKYGSVAITAYDIATADGVNEKNLAVHMLFLPETTTAPRDPAVPGLSISLWAQYYLDNFATVKEAVAALKTHPYQLAMVRVPGSTIEAKVHLALNDATGDSAILECLDGKVVVYHDRSYTVMTNQPPFDKQLENLKQYKGFGGDKRLPGTHEPADRFVRGAYYSKNLPKPKTDREALAALMSVMRNVSAPFGESDPQRPNVSTTIWRTVTDLTNGVLYYDRVDSPSVFWVDVKKLDLSAGRPVSKLTLVGNYDVAGDASAKFVPTPLFEFARPH